MRVALPRAALARGAVWGLRIVAVALLATIGYGMSGAPIYGICGEGRGLYSPSSVLVESGELKYQKLCSLSRRWCPACGTCVLALLRVTVQAVAWAL